MVIFLSSDGTVRATHSGNTGQGSSVNWVYVVAPIAAQYCYLSFALPNGDFIGERLATAVPASEIAQLFTAPNVRAWAYQLDQGVTAYSGTVYYTVRFTFSGGAILTSDRGSFTVAHSVPILPDQPTTTIYNQIKAAVEACADGIEDLTEKTASSGWRVLPVQMTSGSLAKDSNGIYYALLTVGVKTVARVAYIPTTAKRVYIPALIWRSKSATDREYIPVITFDFSGTSAPSGTAAEIPTNSAVFIPETIKTIPAGTFAGKNADIILHTFEGGIPGAPWGNSGASASIIWLGDAPDKNITFGYVLQPGMWGGGSSISLFVHDLRNSDAVFITAADEEVYGRYGLTFSQSGSSINFTVAEVPTVDISLSIAVIKAESWVI